MIVTMTEADYKLEGRIAAMRAYNTMDTMLKVVGK